MYGKKKQGTLKEEEEAGHLKKTNNQTNMDWQTIICTFANRCVCTLELDNTAQSLHNYSLPLLLPQN